jgi:Zn-dependent protease
LNLFNLIPIWQLDGARGFHALTKNQRLLLCGVMFAAWLGTSETLLLLLLAVGLYRAFGKDAPTVPDRRAFFEFVLLIGALSLLQQVNALPAS